MFESCRHTTNTPRVQRYKAFFLGGVRHLREEESMNRKFRSGDGYSILGGLVGLCLFLSLFALPQQSWGAYNYVELPPGWLNPQVNGINNSKSIVGWGGADLTNKGFVFDSNSKAYSEVFSSGWSELKANGINKNGVVVGGGTTADGNFKGFIYQSGVITPLRPVDWLYAEATGINNSGAVVGHGYGVPTSYANKGFLYSGGLGGTFTELLPDTWTDSWAMGINNAGAVVGYGLTASFENVGFLYSNNSYTPLLPAGWTNASALAINNSGAVVGYGTVDIAGQAVTKGFLYYGNGNYTPLLPSGWQGAKATWINDAGIIVGYGNDGAGQQKGFLYRNGTFDEILPPNWVDGQLTGINDLGTLVGWGTDGSGNVKGFSVESVPIPAPIFLLSAGLLALGGLRKLRKDRSAA
jgi:probable HAF family extracellular repeat protein